MAGLPSCNVQINVTAESHSSISVQVQVEKQVQEGKAVEKEVHVETASAGETGAAVHVEKEVNVDSEASEAKASEAKASEARKSDDQAPSLAARIAATDLTGCTQAQRPQKFRSFRGDVTLEAWGKFIITSKGKCTGQTYEEAAGTDPSYCEWLQSHRVTDPIKIDFRNYSKAVGIFPGWKFSTQLHWLMKACLAYACMTPPWMI